MRGHLALGALLWGGCATSAAVDPAATTAASAPPAADALGPQRFAPQRAVDAPANPVRPGATGHRSVQIGALRTDASTLSPAPEVDLGGIAAEVAHNAGYLQRCYEDRVQEVPGLRGAITIHAHITPSGEVSGQCITDDTTHDPVLVACVNTLIAQGRYPGGYVDAVDVTFPFVFSPPPRG